jgi:hypothetical protein
MARQHDHTDHYSKSKTWPLRERLLRSVCLRALCVLCGYSFCAEYGWAAEIRTWAFEATVVQLDDPAFTAADVRLGDTVRGTFSYDLTTAPGNPAPDLATYAPLPGFRGVQVAIENPRTDTRIEYVPVVTQGFEYEIEVWTNGETTPAEEDDESGVYFYQFTTPPNPDWAYSDFINMGFNRPGLLTDFSLPTEYDLDDWPSAWIYLWADDIPLGLTAQFHTVTPVLPGDYDLDGDVDSQDYDSWRSDYGVHGYTDADGNRDSRVDTVDYVIWRDNNLGTGIATSTMIPEPSTALLCFLLCLLAVCLREHKTMNRVLLTMRRDEIG